MSFAEQLQEKLGKHNPEEIEELVLDKIFTANSSLTKEQKEDLQKYTALIHLSMNECGIKSLDNFPKLPKLQILELSTNEINGKDFKSLTDKVPELYKLKIENNKIESLEDLLNLKPLKLTKINILGNPCIDKNTEYRKDLFKKWPELQSIDDEDVEGKVVESTEYGEEESNENDEEGSEDSEEAGEEKEEDEEGEDDEEMDENEEDEEENENNKKNNNNKKSKK